MKKILSLFIFVLCVALNANAQSGSLDNGLTWTVADGVLTISGEGAMPNYTSTAKAPWSNYSFTSIVIENGVTSVGDYAFYGLDRVTKVVIPSTVASLGYQSFASCVRLTEVRWYGTDLKITRRGKTQSSYNFGEHVFTNVTGSSIKLYHKAGADASKWVNLGASIVVFGADANLSWEIENGELSIESTNGNNVAFSYFNDWDEYRAEITSVALDEKVLASESGNYIVSKDGNTLYFACANGEAVTIPEGIESISAKAFYNLGISSLLVASTVTEIGDEAFYGGGSLTNVTALPELAPALGNDVFDTYPEDATLLIKNATTDSRESYEEAWSNYFTLIEKYATEGSYADGAGRWEYDEENKVLTVSGANTDGFSINQTPWNYWLNYATKIVVGDGVTKIGEYSFLGAKASAVEIGSNVEEILEFAFSNSNLADATFTFANNVNVDTGAIASGATKNLVIEEIDRGSYSSADDLMLNTNTYNKVTFVRKFKGGESGVLVIPFAYTNTNYEDFKFYELESYDEENVILQFVEVRDLKANVPYLWRNFGRTVNEITASDVTLDAADMNGSLTSGIKNWELKGTYKVQQIFAKGYVEGAEDNPESDLWLYKSDGTFKNHYDYAWVDPYRAYFVGPEFKSLSSSKNMSAALRSIGVEYVDLDGTTSIENVTIDGDGSIDFSQQDGVYYDLSGRRVERPTAGIYIVNGKKVLVK